MANQNFSMVDSLCTHGQSINGKMADHFKFLILYSVRVENSGLEQSFGPC